MSAVASFRLPRGVTCATPPGSSEFDAWRDDREYAHRCLRAAVDAGADTLTLCDTNGSSLPMQIHEAVSAVVLACEELAAKKRGGLA